MVDGPNEIERSQPYMIVACDSHAGPSLKGDLQPYCPQKYRAAYEEYVREIEYLKSANVNEAKLSSDQLALRLVLGKAKSSDWSALRREADERTRNCAGQNDPYERLRDMDNDGIAADVIFAGGQNGEVMPFVGFGIDAGSAKVSLELRAAGGHIWNLWLADFVSVERERHVGVMQIPIWDVEAAIHEIKWGAEAGLKAINLPAPRSDYPSYNDPIYEPLWSECEALGLPFVTHVAGGENPLGTKGPGGYGLRLAENHWLARRGLWQFIFGGVFERHPGLKLVFTEQRSDWVPSTLQHLDSIYFDDMLSGLREQISKLPSEYWFSNCFNSGSFLAQHEVAMRHEVGLRNLMWGSDYPHVEGTWPRTRLALRNTFAGVPENETRMILGANALSVYNLDEMALRSIADRIGPTPEELAKPLADDEFPEFRGHAFRVRGAFS